MNFYGLDLDCYQKEFVSAILDPNKTIVFVDAAAGTGKTTLAFGAAKMLVADKRNDLDGIIYTEVMDRFLSDEELEEE